MFKLKAGNVFEKINSMDRKQAYTVGAVVAVLIVALLVIGSLMGSADDSSLNDFQARGYDLAAMPFINDEAEQLLLSSKYPDMQGDGSSLLFSQQEKEERQETDGESDEGGDDEEEFDEGGYDEREENSAGYSSGGRSGGGYSGRGGGAGRGKTEIGRLGGASMGRSGGSGMSGSFGAPRGDYSPYKTQNKGEERPIEFKNQDARRALSQFAQGSRAAAGFRDGKLANAKRALQGGDILGSEAFAGNGVDLSKTNGLALDTNAPIGSNPDLSNLKDKVSNEAKKAENKQKEDKKKEKSFGEKLLSALGDAVVNSLANAAGDLLSMGWDATKGWVASWGAGGRAQGEIDALMSMPAQSWDKLTANQQAMFSNNEALYNQCVNLNDQGYGTWKENAINIVSGLQDSFNNYKSQRRKDDFHRYFNPEKYSSNKDYTGSTNGVGSTTAYGSCLGSCNEGTQKCQSRCASLKS